MLMPPAGHAVIAIRLRRQICYTYTRGVDTLRGDVSYALRRCLRRCRATRYVADIALKREYEERARAPLCAGAVRVLVQRARYFMRVAERYWR